MTTAFFVSFTWRGLSCLNLEFDVESPMFVLIYYCTVAAAKKMRNEKEVVAEQ